MKNENTKIQEPRIKMESYKVTIELDEDFLGTVPKDKQIWGPTLHKDKNVAEELLTGEISTIPEDEEEKSSGYTTFMRDEDGIFIYNYMIQGFLRENGNTLKDDLGVKNLKSKLENNLFIRPRRIRFYQEEDVVRDYDATLPRSLRTIGKQGPRTMIQKSDLVSAGSRLTFTLTLHDHKELTSDVLQAILEYGQYRGLGQWRNGGYGTFHVVSFEKV